MPGGVAFIVAAVVVGVVVVALLVFRRRRTLHEHGREETFEDAENFAEAEYGDSWQSNVAAAQQSMVENMDPDGSEEGETMNDVELI